MQERNSTHLYVTAKSYPALMDCLQSLTPKKIDPAVLGEMMQAPIFAVPVIYASSLGQNYVKDASMINLTLTKIGKVIDILENVKYEHLSDVQRKRIVEFAKEIDDTDAFVRGEIYTSLTTLHKELHEKLQVQQGFNQAYIKNVGQYLDQLLDFVKQETGLDISWSEGKQVLQWQEIEGWLSRYSEVDRTTVLSLKTEDASLEEEAEQFMKTIVYAESLIACSKVDEDKEKRLFSKSISQKAKAACERCKLEVPKCEEVDPMSLSLFKKMENVFDKVNTLLEEAQSFPSNDDDLADDVKNEFKDSLAKETEFSTMVFEDDLKDVKE